MFRWLIVIFVVLMLANAFTPWVKKLGFGKFPGDFRFSIFGREMFLPVTTTVILSMVAAGLSRLF
jgi:2-oxoglutarate dehydrogenase complex dehydrogenase (E1) component-like enzyme